MFVSHRSVWRNPIHFLAFGFAVGTIRVMPGTFGSLIAIPLYLLMLPLTPTYYFVVVLILFILGIGLCGKTARDLNAPDYSGIVWDEIVGMLLVLGFVQPTISSVVIAFILFRLFDVWKPWPISWLNTHVKSGIGIMLDDAIAAICAILILEFFKILFLHHF